MSHLDPRNASRTPSANKVVSFSLLFYTFCCCCCCPHSNVVTLSDWNKIGTAVASALRKSNQRLAFPLQGPPATFRLRRTRVGQAISPSLFARPINRHASLLQRYFSRKIISLYIQTLGLMLFASIYVFRLEIS